MTIVDEEKLQNCISRREIIFSRMQSLFDSTTKDLINNKDNLADFLVRYDRIEIHYVDFDSVQAEIFALCLKLKDTTTQLASLQQTTAFEDLYYRVRACARINNFRTTQEKLAEANKVAPSTSVSVTRESVAVAPRLPKLEIPVFTGELHEWSNFYALFETTIDKNKSLSNIEKFQYLKTFLGGPALSLIESLPLSPANYPIAYKTVVDRYQNKRNLGTYYLNKLFSFRPLSSDSLDNLRKHYDCFQTTFAAYLAVGLGNPADFFAMHLALRALDVDTRQRFETNFDMNEVPTFDNLMVFVQKQCHIKEISQGTGQPPQVSVQRKPATPHQPSSSSYGFRSARNTLVSTAQPTPASASCPLCKENHKLFQCSSFQAADPTKRYELVKSHKKCFNCLGNHMLSECKSRSRCSKCSSPTHHTLLHFVKPHAAVLAASPVPASSDDDVNILTCHTREKSTVLLATAQARIQDASGSFQPIRLLIDPGSEISCISSSAVQQLGLKVSSSRIHISGIGNNHTLQSKGSVICKLLPSLASSVEVATEAVILSKISSDLPSVSLPAGVREQYSSICLADSDFHKSGKIDFLLGADLYPHILVTKGPTIIQGEPVAINTIFGWVLMGKVPVPSSSEIKTSLFVHTESADPLDALMKRFWEVEEVSTQKFENPEDKTCEEFYQDTTVREPNGRYCVSLPFKEEPPAVGSTRDIALRRFLSLESRLHKQPQLFDEYKKFIDEYRELGHLSLATYPSPFIIPHHCVYKNDKLRVVFDSSVKDNNGISLNESLMIGPKLQSDIPDIILSMRFHRVALCADVKMMFRGISLNSDHRKYQHIFWRDSPNAPLQELELNTVTYGFSSSPYLAQRTMRQLVEDEGKSFPLASHAVLHETYVDDITSGAADVKTALVLRDELIALLGKAQLSLRKWASSHPEILSDLPTDHVQSAIGFGGEDGGALKVLGLEWRPNQDVFTYTITPPVIDSQHTKRSILSTIARLFDPVGWLSPTTFFAKCIIQRTWLAGLDWSAPLPEEIAADWNNFLNQIVSLSEISIPRFCHITPSSKYSILGFCDGSEKGYAAVLYLRSASSENDIHISLLKAKSRVAPLKSATIPRLELLAALLLSRLLVSIQGVVQKLNVKNVFLFSDSTVVLGWLRTSPHRLKTFVANRVVEILDNTAPSSWHHISTHENPADCASRGLLPKDLVKHPLWWTGPSFISQPQDTWSLTNYNVTTEDLPEVKTNVMVATEPEKNLFLAVIEKHSSLVRLQRVVGFVLRFVHNVRSAKSLRKTGPLGIDELNKSMDLCVRVVQEDNFSDVMKRMMSDPQFKHSLRRLSPFTDEKHLVRVGGRLKNSELSYTAKHPLLLPKESRLSVLICIHYHLYTLHGGPLIVQSIVQRRYWILSLRSLVRQCIFKCLPCYKLKAQTLTPPMSDLPAVRFEQIRAFLNVFVDYAGFFLLKESTRRNAKTYKGYMAIFICMSTKAIHLEVVTDLSTSAFLAALDRFVARRGLAAKIYSDNGTNFVGAARHLKEVYQLLRQSHDEISDYLGQREIRWYFNPPNAPNFSGLVERGVQSVKHHIKRVIGEQSLTYELFATFCCRCESIINSKPLCGLPSSDPHDGNDYLTPAHFLVGSTLLSVPEEDLTSQPMNRLNRWQLIRQAVQSFWRRWSNEYLHTLMPRSKWNTESRELKLGEVVFVQSTVNQMQPLRWPIGRVEQLIAGRDGIVRVAEIRVANGVLLTRPLNKLVPLPYPHTE
uniref:Integrase catalytic domain-containing protein n=2 Tax=Cacopsylla melanoneura TaxID=428564 RepID=A0A8D8SQJ6_9HEMI